jgi:hypothetical protein
MKATPVSILLSMVLFLACQATADDDYVAFAKTLPAKEFDKSLPAIPTDQWLSSSLPPGIAAVWGSHVTDCGEQTGDPEIDKERDMPLCAEIELKKKGNVVGYLLLFIGTKRKGKMKETSRLYYGYIRQGDKTIEVKRLQDITQLK